MRNRCPQHLSFLSLIHIFPVGERGCLSEPKPSPYPYDEHAMIYYCLLYTSIEEQEDDGEPFEEKMGRLTSELSELFTKSHELEAQIKDCLLYTSRCV